MSMYDILGANGLANPRDFLYPVAAFEDKSVDEWNSYVKFDGRLYVSKQVNIT